MSFCCGAGMIGRKGTLKHLHTSIHNVPTLFCPVCKRTEVHYLIRSEFEILAEYATGDGTPEINFMDYVQGRKSNELFENCINTEKDDPMDLIENQIDMSLDLLSVAKELRDEEWGTILKIRLKSLSQQREVLSERRISG
ncbi:MAG: hypothetical protein H7X86_08825 [Gorillibacterium sp.]|nr:hypothetical protein [Gorillibacterium sp.]